MVKSVTLYDNEANSEIVAELGLTATKELSVWLRFMTDDGGGLSISLNIDELLKAIEYLRQ